MCFFLIIIFSHFLGHAEEPLPFEGKIELGTLSETTWSPLPSANAFVVLHPLYQLATPDILPKKWVVDMNQKEFLPSHLLVRVGDEVSFKNSDHFNHNVFSLSKELTFDLGSYSFGQSRKVLTREDGLVRVYCNVHANMAFFLLVSSSPWATPTNAKGEFIFSHLPKGKYEMHVWHWQGHQIHQIDWAGTKISSPFRLDIGKVQHPHKNKYGLTYPPEEDDDEIY